MNLKPPKPKDALRPMQIDVKHLNIVESNTQIRRVKEFRMCGIKIELKGENTKVCINKIEIKGKYNKHVRKSLCAEIRCLL